MTPHPFYATWSNTAAVCETRADNDERCARPAADPVHRCDWRGVPIEGGATVVYGAPVGRSIALVEAVVEGFTKSGRVNVRVIRRAYGGGWVDGKEVVHVGSDRLTVVEALPPSTVPTEAEVRAERRRQLDEADARRATHDLPELVTETDRYGWPHRTYPPCRRCGIESCKASQQACEVPA